MVQPVQGQQGASFQLPIEQGKVLEFVESLSAKAWTHDSIPPTFLTTAFFWEARVEGADVKTAVQFDPSRSVHAEQTFVFHGPPPSVGETLTAQSRVDKIYEKTSRQGKVMTFVDITTDYYDPNDELRASSTMRAIEFAPENS